MRRMPILNRPLHILSAVILFALGVAGCATTSSDFERKTKSWDAARFYSEAKESLKAGEYEEAIKYFETLESRFPFGRYAQQAQLEVAYAYYKYDDPESATAATNRFIKINPLHPYVDYAMYLKGLINFNRGVSIFDRFTKDDYSKRDPSMARQAYQDFATLVSKFPDSRYSADARQRVNYLYNSLAAHEVHVANYYLRRKAYLAAANRAKDVLEEYQRAPAVAEALVIMVRSYRGLGLTQLERDTRRVIQRNFAQDEAVISALRKLDRE